MLGAKEYQVQGWPLMDGWRGCSLGDAPDDVNRASFSFQSAQSNSQKLVNVPSVPRPRR